MFIRRGLFRYLFCLCCLSGLGQLVGPLQAAGEALPLVEAVRVVDHARVKSLLASGADVNAVSPAGASPLHWASQYRQPAILAALLEAGANPNVVTDTGVTPLELSIIQRDAAAVRLLLNAGAEPQAHRLSGETLLMLAAETGNVDILSALLESGAVVDTRDPHYGQTALMFAARAGHLDATRLLLEQGADPDAATDIGPTPPWIGPNSVPGFGYGEGIIRGGVPADRGRREPIPGGMTSLLYAARHGHVEVARALLAHGASIEQAEANAIFPLLMAISNDRVAMAQFLLEQGARVNGQDWYGRSPLWEAVNVRNLYIHNAKFENYVAREPYLPLIQTLLESGAAVNVRTEETPPFRHHLLEITGSLEWVDFTGQTPFLTAALAGDLAVMELLLAYDADPHINTYGGTTALMAAAGVNWVVAQTWTEGPQQLLAAVKLCHALGMDVNQSNSMGLTALHGAANRGSNEIIEYLVSQGARLDARDELGRSALDWAEGVFLATHPAEAKPDTMALISRLMREHGKALR